MIGSSDKAARLRKQGFAAYKDTGSQTVCRESSAQGSPRTGHTFFDLPENRLLSTVEWKNQVRADEAQFWQEAENRLQARQRAWLARLHQATLEREESRDAWMQARIGTIKDKQAIEASKALWKTSKKQEIAARKVQQDLDRSTKSRDVGSLQDLQSRFDWHLSRTLKKMQWAKERDLSQQKQSSKHFQQPLLKVSRRHQRDYKHHLAIAVRELNISKKQSVVPRSKAESPQTHPRTENDGPEHQLFGRMPQTTDKQPADHHPAARSCSETAPELMQAASRGQATQLADEKESADVNDMAIKVQALVRGHLARKLVKGRMESERLDPASGPEHSTDVSPEAHSPNEGCSGEMRSSAQKADSADALSVSDAEKIPGQSAAEKCDCAVEPPNGPFEHKGQVEPAACDSGIIPGTVSELWGGEREETEQACLIKIQAAVRGHLVRKKLRAQPLFGQELDKSPRRSSGGPDASEQESSAVKIQAAFRGRIARKHLQGRSNHLGEPPSRCIPDKLGTGLTMTAPTVALLPPQISPAEQNGKNAAKIQALFRGHLVRKRLGNVSHASPNRVRLRASDEIAASCVPSSQLNALGADLDSGPGITEHTIKIQSAFRGMKARQLVTQIRLDSTQG